MDTSASPNATLKVGLSLLSASPEQFTGTGRYVDELVRELAHRPREIGLEVLCNEESIQQASGWAGPSVKVMRAAGFDVGGSRASRMRAISLGLLRPRGLARQFSPETEVVHYPLIIPLPPVSVATIVNLHDVQHHEHPENYSRSQRVWRGLAYDRAARHASLVITPSNHARDRAIQYVGIEPNRVVAIGHAVDHNRFHPDADSGDEFLESLPLPKKFLFYPASLWPHKNHARLIAALAQLADREVHLVLSGATLGRLPELVAEAEARGVGDRVHHLGFISERALPAVYRSAAALAFPSTYEGFGVPPVEAMACGCPVASSRAASLAEVCGDAALELDPQDTTQMAASLDRVLSDRILRRDLRERGFRRAGHFSWSAVGDAHVAAYRRAIKIGPT